MENQNDNLLQNNEEKKLTWFQYQMANHYLQLIILFAIVGAGIPLLWGMDYILTLPICWSVATLILILGTRAYKIYAKGGTS